MYRDILVANSSFTCPPPQKKSFKNYHLNYTEERTERKTFKPKPLLPDHTVGTGIETLNESN